MDGLEDQGFDEAVRLVSLASEFPRRDMLEILIVAFGFAIGILPFLAEMTAAAFLAFERVEAK
jgi:hypothetical protein